MSSLRFAPEAEAQLQRAFQDLANSDRRADYDKIVSTLASIERDAALFTLLEATALPIDGIDAYGVVLETSRHGVPIVIIYGMTTDDDVIVIYTIRW